MLNHVVSASSAIIKRAIEDDDKTKPGQNQLPGWAFLVILLDLIVFLPVILYVMYTLASVYPTLAVIEDTKPPAYEPVPLNEDGDSIAEDSPAAPLPRKDDASEAPAITSSIRSIDRVLRSNGGWRANFRGFWCAWASSFATGMLTAIFIAVPFVPTFVGTLLANLALVQIDTTWVHMVISTRPGPFWRRLPPFRKTFEATCFPVLIFWIANTASNVVPTLVAQGLGLPIWDPKNPTEMPEFKGHSGATLGKSLVVIIVGLFLAGLFVVPAHVVLVRVQASLLSPDEETIIPFDHTFDGTITEPAVAGKGYVSMRNALQTFPRSAWIRLYVLYVKVFAVSVAVWFLFSAIVVVEMVVGGLATKA